MVTRRPRVGLIGCCGEAEQLARAYVRSQHAELIGVADPDRPEAARALADELGIELYEDPLTLQKNAAAIEICLSPQTASDWIEHCVEAQQPCRALYPCAEELGRLQTLVRRCESFDIPALLLFPPLHYPPLIKARQLLRDELLGDVQTLRMRAILGGEGGWWEGGMPRFERPRGSLLLHDKLFDMLPLALLFIGSIEQMRARIEPPDASGAQSCQLSWRYEGGQGHGVFEALRAPQMFVKSWDEPMVEELELSGTDGYLWLHRMRGMGRDRPALETYVHTTLCAHGGKLPLQWSTVYDRAVRAFAESLGSKRHKQTQGASLGLAVQALELVLELSRS
ncbi:MAG: Gfo/Idh/MocA family oxidoreductase [Candidatus Alcyoniella australis]|nr:Gfo/Idh/MocA family oxidoreductase [Candidatus Alcyoniella australis]